MNTNYKIYKYKQNQLILTSVSSIFQIIIYIFLNSNKSGVSSVGSLLLHD